MTVRSHPLTFSSRSLVRSRSDLVKTAVVLGILAATAGCSVPKKSTPKEVKQAVEKALPKPPDVWSVAKARVGEVQVGWIDRLNDPVLSKLVREAQANNKDLQASAANVEKSWALADQAKAGLSPSLSVSAGADNKGNIDTGKSVDSLNIGLQASWEADVWGRIKAGKNAAVLNAEAAEADLRYAQYSMAAAVARAYFLAIEAGLQADVSQKTLTAQEKTNAIVKVQYDLGEANAQDLYLSQSDMQSTRSSLIAARGAQRDALRALEVLLGRYPSAELKLRTSLPALPPPPPAGLPSQILERRPDIVAAERRVAASFQALDQAKVANLPSVSLTGSLGGSSQQLSNLLNPANLAWTIGSSLVAPLLDGGRNKAQIAQATAEQKQAIAAYGQAGLKAFEDVEKNLDGATVLGEQAAALQLSADSANKALNIADLRYKEGESALLDVLNIQQRVYSADRNLTSMQRNRLDNWISLNLALGGGWQ